MPYLDHAATTPMLPEAIAAVAAAMGQLGNPSSLHGSGRAGPAAGSRSRASSSPRRWAPGPSEVVFTAGGTESDNLAVKGIYWARRDADPRRRRVLASAVEHHAVLDSVDVARRARGRRGRLAARRRARAGRPGGAARRPGRRPRRRRPGQRHVGQQRGRHRPADRRAGRGRARVRRARCTPTRCRPSARCPSTSPPAGVDALTMTGHKLGGPIGAGALLLRRDVACVPLLHGGGQERDVRSGTLDVPGGRRPGRWPRRSPSSASHGSARRRVAGCAADLVAGVLAAGARRRQLQRPPDPAPARHRPPVLPRLRGRLAADAARRPRRRVLDRFGLLGRCGPAVARAARHGRRRGAGPRLAALLPRPHLDRRRTSSTPLAAHRPGGRARPPRRAHRGGGS